MTAAIQAWPAGPFAESRARVEEMLGWLEGEEAAGLSHSELEDGVDVRGREVLRQFFQDHLSLRAQREQRIKEVLDADGVAHGSVEAGHTRALTTIFGAVSVERLAYRHRGVANLHPADGALNLPEERHSHGLRRLAAIESTRGSYDDAAEAIGRATGVAVAKRQVEDLTRSAAADVGDFYGACAPEPGSSDDVLVVSVDGKGIVMRPDSLRPATEKAAAAGTTKLETRLSKGEKRVAGAERLVGHLPGDEHAHHNGLAAAGGHLQADAVEAVVVAEVLDVDPGAEVGLAVTAGHLGQVDGRAPTTAAPTAKRVGTRRRPADRQNRQGEDVSSRASDGPRSNPGRSRDRRGCARCPTAPRRPPWRRRPRRPTGECGVQGRPDVACVWPRADPACTLTVPSLVAVARPGGAVLAGTDRPIC